MSDVTRATLARSILGKIWFKFLVFIISVYPSDWVTHGEVVGFDRDKGEIILWLTSFDEVQTTRITSSMPTWLLKQGVRFQSTIARPVSRFLVCHMILSGVILWNLVLIQKTKS